MDQFNLPDDIYKVIFATEQQEVVGKMLTEYMWKNGGEIGKTEMSLFATALHEGKAVIKKKDGSMTSEYVNYADIADEEVNIMNAAKSCPVNAIIIVEVDEQGNEVKQVWPEA